MKSRNAKILFPVLAIVFATLALTTTSYSQERQKRIAVLDFEFDAIQKWWEGDWNVGAGISEILVTKFFEDGTYQLVDRNAIELILKEQDFTHSSRFDPSSAAQLGKLLGADALVIGSVTQFGTEKQSTGGIGGLLGKKAGFLGKVGLKKDKAKCIINARLIDVNTGTIIAVAEGEGKSSRKGLLLGAAGGNSNRVGGGLFQMTSSGFRETILGEATNLACQNVVEQIVASAPEIQQAKLEINGLVADFDSELLEVTITPGSEAGVSPDQMFRVVRVTNVVKHPVTGEVIREKTSDVCLLKIIEAGSGYAVAKPIGSGSPEPGDKVLLVLSEEE